MNCYLHIGMPKTGSSSIQRSLGAAKNISGGTYLNAFEIDNHSIPFITIFAKNPRQSIYIQELEKTKAKIQQLRARWFSELKDYLESMPSKCVVISGENIPLIDIWYYTNTTSTSNVTLTTPSPSSIPNT